MSEILGMLRASWQTVRSYRLNFLFSIFGLALTLIPVYFIAQAIQPLAADSIRNEGGHYLGFLLTGMAVLGMVQSAMSTLPSAIGGGIATGTLEAMLATPARLPALILGLVAYECLWAVLRGAIMLLTAAAMGVTFHLGGSPAALVSLFLMVATYFGVGLVLAAMMLAFRTTGPIPSGIIAATSLLGGVYYSTTVIPSWIQKLSVVVPLTYGLRAFRQSVLSGDSWATVGPDLLAVAALATVSLAIGIILFTVSLNWARHEGSLGQY